MKAFGNYKDFFISGFKADLLFFCPELFLGENEPFLIEQLYAKGAKLIECSQAIFHKISYRDRPDGLLAVATQTHHALNDLKKFLKPNIEPFLIVAEAIEKPGNLGTILRSSDASGVDALIVCDPCTDIFNPNVVRASVGTLFSVPVIESTSQKTIDYLKAQKIKIIAASPQGPINFTEADLRGPLAIAVGTEQLGLSPLWMEQADLLVKIPMCGLADSLNVAMATTLMLYEVLRQRNIKING